MVRRWKPQEGTGAAPTAKSRWCVRGHQDPDAPELQVYAPTPQTETLMVILMIIAGLGWDMELAD
eukprot:11209026-Lingulodinium_polyedra.AAC.1